MKKLLVPSLAILLSVAITTGDALADAVSVYTAAFICGDGGSSSAAPAKAGAVTPSNYRTAVQIVNPNNMYLNTCTDVVFTEARGVNLLDDIVGQSAQLSLGGCGWGNSLDKLEALEFNCDTIGDTFDHDFSAGGFATGFLIVYADPVFSPASAPLNVTAVYSTRGKTSGTAGSCECVVDPDTTVCGGECTAPVPSDRAVSMDTEEVKGRRLVNTAGQIASDHHEDGN